MCMADFCFVCNLYSKATELMAELASPLKVPSSVCHIPSESSAFNPPPLIKNYLSQPTQLAKKMNSVIGINNWIEGLARDQRPPRILYSPVSRESLFWMRTAGLSTYRYAETAVPEMPLWSWNVYRLSGVFQSFLRFLASLAQLCCTEFCLFSGEFYLQSMICSRGTLLLFLLVDLPGN